MFEKPIIIFSDYCSFSKNFIETLMKHPELFETFIRMNIDVNPITKKRPQAFYQLQQSLDIKITKVPTIITPNAEYILSDIDAFKWLEHQIRLLKTDEGELKPFNPNEMISFSDNYSKFGSTDLCDAKEQSFKFYDKGVLQDDNFLQTKKAWDPDNVNGFLDDSEEPTNIDYTSKQNERQFFDESRKKQTPNSNFQNNYVQQTNNNVDVSAKYTNNIQRQQMAQRQPPRKNINFVDSNFSHNKGSQKGKEMDVKLAQLMNDRDSMNNDLSQRPRY